MTEQAADPAVDWQSIAFRLLAVIARSDDLYGWEDDLTDPERAALGLPTRPAIDAEQAEFDAILDAVTRAHFDDRVAAGTYPFGEVRAQDWQVTRNQLRDSVTAAIAAVKRRAAAADEDTT